MEAYPFWKGMREDGQTPKDVISYDGINTLYFEHRQKINMRKTQPRPETDKVSEVIAVISEEATLSASRCFFIAERGIIVIIVISLS